MMNRPMDVVARFETPNLPPQFLQPLQLTLLEDEDFRRSFDWLNQTIMDPNDPLEYLTFHFTTGPHMSIVLDKIAREIRIVLEADWSGTDSVKVTVTDPYGLKASGQFIINVLPVNDDPGPFNLVVPPYDTVLNGTVGPMAFTWERSKNVDPGDRITYSFYFSPSPSLSGPGTIVIVGRVDTSLVSTMWVNGTYYWGVWAEDSFHKKTRCNTIFRISFPTDVETEDEGLPSEYSLSQNYPNPFNPSTTIPYSLPKPEKVMIQVLDVRGTVIRTLVDAIVDAGYHEVVWDGRNTTSEPLPSGVYIIRFRAGSFVQQRKMMMLQ